MVWFGGFSLVYSLVKLKLVFCSNVCKLKFNYSYLLLLCSSVKQVFDVSIFVNDVNKVMWKVRCLSVVYLLQQGIFFNFIMDVVVQIMNIIFFVCIMKCLVFIMVFCIVFIFVVYVDDLNIKIMILGVLQIDVEFYILIDYNFGKVFVEQNVDVRCDFVSLIKMMISYVIGQVMKVGKFKEIDLVIIGNDVWVIGNSVFKGFSLMFFKLGMQVSVFQLICGINL